MKGFDGQCLASAKVPKIEDSNSGRVVSRVSDEVRRQEFSALILSPKSGIDSVT